MKSLSVELIEDFGGVALGAVSGLCVNRGEESRPVELHSSGELGQPLFCSQQY